VLVPQMMLVHCGSGFFVQKPGTAMPVEIQCLLHWEKAPELDSDVLLPIISIGSLHVPAATWGLASRRAFKCLGINR